MDWFGNAKRQPCVDRSKRIGHPKCTDVNKSGIHLVGPASNEATDLLSTIKSFGVRLRPIVPNLLAYVGYCSARLSGSEYNGKDDCGSLKMKTIWSCQIAETRTSAKPLLMSEPFKWRRFE